MAGSAIEIWGTQIRKYKTATHHLFHRGILVIYKYPQRLVYSTVLLCNSFRICLIETQIRCIVGPTLGHNEPSTHI